MASFSILPDMRPGLNGLFELFFCFIGGGKAAADKTEKSE